MLSFETALTDPKTGHDPRLPSQTREVPASAQFCKNSDLAEFIKKLTQKSMKSAVNLLKRKNPKKNEQRLKK